MGEKYLEDALRYFFEKAASLVRLSMVNIGEQLDNIGIGNVKPDENPLILGRYSIIGFFLIVTAFIYFMQLNSFFAPSYIVFSFLVVFLSGVFLYLNKA